MNLVTEQPKLERRISIDATRLSNIAILLVAIFAAFIHYLPYLHAEMATPDGWYFTGNVSNSPDMMQYRVWMRQTQQTGVLVENKFTSEDNKPHILVIFYYIIDQIALLLNIQPEYAYYYIGTLLAFVLTLLLFTSIRQFTTTLTQTWTIFLVVLLGGGLGAHIKILSNVGFIRNNPILFKLLVEPAWNVPFFEDYRGNYIIKVLFDTHFLLVWIMSLLAVLCFYLTVTKFTYSKLVITAFIFAITGLLHLYEGITLLVIITFIMFLLWWKKYATRRSYLVYIVCSISVLISLILFSILYRSSNLPMPTWRGLNVLFSVLIISYPLAWLLIAFGFNRYWQGAGFKETYLVGWTLGCTLLTLSGPFYPYPDRGTVTLQIPLYVIAGTIFFTQFKRMKWGVFFLAIVLLGVTPLWVLQDRWEWTAFNPKQNYTFINSEHMKIIEYLKNNTGEDDILVTDPSIPAAMNDLLWLAPNYPGKFYCGHFFLTVEYERKCAEVSALYQGGLDDPDAFLTMNRIRFIFIPPEGNPAPIRDVPNIRLVISSSVGSLYEHNLK